MSAAHRLPDPKWFLLFGVATSEDGSVTEYPTVQYEPAPAPIDHAATRTRPAFRTTFRAPTDEELDAMGLARLPNGAEETQLVPVGWKWNSLPGRCGGRWWPSGANGSRKWIIPDLSIYTFEVLAQGTPILPEEAGPGDCVWAKYWEGDPSAAREISYNLVHPSRRKEYPWLRPHATKEAAPVVADWSSGAPEYPDVPPAPIVHYAGICEDDIDEIWDRCKGCQNPARAMAVEGYRLAMEHLPAGTEITVGADPRRPDDPRAEVERLRAGLKRLLDYLEGNGFLSADFAESLLSEVTP